MRLSLRAVAARESLSQRRSGACLETSTVRLFLMLGKRGRYGSVAVRPGTRPRGL